MHFEVQLTICKWLGTIIISILLISPGVMLKIQVSSIWQARCMINKKTLNIFHLKNRGKHVFWVKKSDVLYSLGFTSSWWLTIMFFKLKTKDLQKTVFFYQKKTKTKKHTHTQHNITQHSLVDKQCFSNQKAEKHSFLERLVSQ